MLTKLIKFLYLLIFLIVCLFIAKIVINHKQPYVNNLLRIMPEKDLSLTNQCKIRKKILKIATNDSLNFIIDPPFVIGGDLAKDELSEILQYYIIEPSTVMWENYFSKKPNMVITVLLFKGQKSYKKWVRELQNQETSSYFGYYLHSIRTLIMDINTGSGTLIHELTHALIDFDYPEAPTWFNEGLASLHEAVFIKKNRLVGLKNWRLPTLIDALKNKRLQSLKDLVTKRKWNEHTDVNYAQSRYFIMFTQSKGLLVKFYHIHKKGIQTKTYNDVKAIELTFGEKIENIEKEFLNWIIKIP